MKPTYITYIIVICEGSVDLVNFNFMDVDIRMLHSLMVQVETYLTHRSFSSKEGGFKIRINGVQIYKVGMVDGVVIKVQRPSLVQEHDDELTKEFDSALVLFDLLKAFMGYANEVVEACDAEQGSYDIMILFTGRSNFSDVSPGYSKGLAFVGEVCMM